MVMKKLTIYAFLIFTGVVCAKDREVTSLEILKIGIAYEGRSEIEKKACSYFKPTKKQLIYFFENAIEFDEGGEIAHEYYSPCIATGKVIFADGIEGRWTVQSSGYGYGIFNNKELNFFLKDNEWNDDY